MEKVNINILGDAVGKVAESITQLTKSLDKWLSSANIRRMAKCIRIGDQVVKRIHELKVDDKELNKLIESWDKFNN